MSKEEAISKMKQGKKVTHENFCLIDWVTINDGFIITSGGSRQLPYDFWKKRTHNSWDYGYSIVKN